MEMRTCSYPNYERERERERVVGSIQARRRRVGYICKLRERGSHGW